MNLNNKIYSHLEEIPDGIKTAALGKKTKKFLDQKGRKEAANQGWFNLNHKTRIAIPLGVDIENWKQKMILKYSNYDKDNASKRLSGAAKI